MTSHLLELGKENRECSPPSLLRDNPLATAVVCLRRSALADSQPRAFLALLVSDRTVAISPSEQAAKMDSFRQEKVQRFEEFVDCRLKPDLVHAVEERDKVFEQQKVFSDLRRNIENLEKNSVTSLRTLVNLGSEVYMQADVPDTRHIFVDVGLGFHLEFTWPEALNFIAVREERQIEEYTHLIASIKAQIKLVCEGIRELLQLPDERSH
ncbi:uncharacterized protein LOC131143743 isoform X2 [Malania oleifera]|uniref:uncharacterized protein LOC131143743 isoform X2 n=1 Tax=Malania oleifera TaxID=397392 RepID=UPI0025AEC668|nr:uncharacterized protein LOC131143743 isoform X2 [Malania oleifera]